MDHLYIKRCIELAYMGQGKVSPNPMVGAVIVHENNIIGESYHKEYGQAHAEVNAINAVLSKYGQEKGEILLQESSLYVSLEPCASFGKTPPCVDGIIAYRIPRVVLGTPDPTFRIAHESIKKLQAAGIEVIQGPFREDCLELNKRFFIRSGRQRPYVFLQWAQTSNGFFAKNDDSRFWFTGSQAEHLSHKWRSEEDAILVGSRTVRIDNPQLTVRSWTGRNPLRLILDKNLQLSPNLNIFNQAAKTVVFNERLNDIKDHIQYVSIKFDENLVPSLLSQLHKMNVGSLIVEGGAILLNQFINHDLWDEAHLFTNTKLTLTEGIRAPMIQKGIFLRKEQLDNTDELTIYRNASSIKALKLSV